MKHPNPNSNFNKRFVGIAIILALFTVGLLLYNIFSGTIEDGIRDFIAEQGIWAKSQKTAVINLMYYVQSGNKDKFANYQQEMRKLLMDDRAIDSLKNNSSTKVDSLFSPLLRDLKTDNNYRDLTTFVSVYSSPVLSFIMPNAQLFTQAFVTRENAEHQLLHLQELAQAIKEEYRNGIPSYSQREQYLKKMYSIDRRLTTLAHQFTYNLSDLSRTLNQFSLINLIAIGLVLLFVGGFSSVRYIQNLKKWKSKLIRNNKELRSSKKTYQDLLNSLQDGIIIQNEKGRFMDVNPAAANMFGYRESEMVGITPEDIIAPESLDRTRQTTFFEEALSGEKRIFERWARRKDGSVFPMEVTLSYGKFFDEDVVIATIRDITDRRESIKKLQQANQQNQVLMQEIHHRVKNNMALIASLLQLQAFDITDPEMQSILFRSQSRIHAIAEVHEQLYQSKNLASVEFKSYLDTFIESFNRRKSKGTKLNIKTKAPSFSLNVNQALPTALLLNEILLHITEYQLTEKDQEINIDIKKERDQVKIDIMGKPTKGKEDLPTESQLGLEIIHTLTKQIDASFETFSNGKLQYQIVFKRKEDLKGSGSSL